MARLKDRNRFPPKGFTVMHPEAGMTKPVDNLSFMEAVQWEMKFRRQNPHLVKKHDWPTDQRAVESWVDEQNALRCMAHGWIEWVDLGGEAPPLPDPPQKKTSVWRSVAGGVKRVLSGAVLYADWLGHGGQPVEPALAEKRAAVCADCPKNDGGDFTSYFTEPIADQIRALLQIKHDLNLSTTQDEKLTVCSACECPLKLKVWAPLKHINGYLPAESRSRLDPRCWVLHET